MDATTTELVIRMVVGLAVVGGLMLLITRTARSRLGGSARSPLEVLGRHALTKSSSVAVVRAGTRHLLVGVGEHGVTVLAEGDDLLASARPEAVDGVGDAVVDAVVDVRTEPEPQTRARPARAPRPGSRNQTPGANAGVLSVLRDKTVRRA